MGGCRGHNCQRDSAHAGLYATTDALLPLETLTTETLLLNLRTLGSTRAILWQADPSTPFGLSDSWEKRSFLLHVHVNRILRGRSVRRCIALPFQVLLFPRFTETRHTPPFA